jgi:hypothetical protein
MADAPAGQAADRVPIDGDKVPQLRQQRHFTLKGGTDGLLGGVPVGRRAQ